MYKALVSISSTVENKMPTKKLEIKIKDMTGNNGPKLRFIH
jgi:hypothetical protein